MSLPEVSAAVSVLLGFAPPASLSAAGSSKLNEVLVPNPFNRPHAVFVLEVRGIADPTLLVKQNSMLKSAYETKIDLGLKKAEIELPDESEVSVFSLDEQSADYNDIEISNFASWMGGSYVPDTLEALNGELAIPLANGDQLKLHMSKVLEEQYGSDGVAQHGMEVLVAVMTKISDLLEHAYKGQIVGAILFDGVAPVESGKMLNVVFTSRPSARWLAETKTPTNTTVVEVLLVRKTIAWITGIILLIATLLGVYFLLNMPITRDTLLYSNVKLD